MKKYLLIFLFFTAGLQATMSWSSPTTLSDPSLASLGSSVVFDLYQNAVASWTAVDGSNNFFSQTAEISLGGDWSSVTNLATWGTSGTTGLSIAFDSSGNATAIWPEPDGLYTATKSFGGDWTAASQIVAASVLSPSLAVASDGTATAVWVDSDDSRVYASTRLSGSWLEAAAISAAGGAASAPQVAVANSSRRFYAIWIRNNGSNTIVQVAQKTFGQDWAPATNLSATGQNASTPGIAIDASENVTAIWARSDGTNTIIQSSTHIYGGSWPASGTDLSASGQNATTPQIAVNAAGATYAIWARSNGTNTIIQVKQRDALKGWDAAATDLSATGQNATIPQIAIDPSGDVVAVWQRSDGSNTRIQAITKFVGLSWSAVSTLSTAGQNAVTPRVAIDFAANARVVWSYNIGSSLFVIQASQGTPSTSYVESSIGAIPTVTWGSAINMSQSGSDAFYQSAVADTLGNVLTGWQILINGDNLVQATDVSSTGNWAVPVEISTPGQLVGLGGIFGYDGSGNATAIWTQNSGEDEYELYSAQKLAGQSWGSPIQVSLADAGSSALVVDSTNRATAVWVQSDGLNNQIYASTRSSGTWSIPEAISSAGGDATSPELTVDSAGNVYALWLRNNGSTTVVQAARKAAGGAWGSVSSLSDSGQNSTNPQIACDPSGDVYAVWQRYNGSNQIVQTATYSGGSWGAAVDLSATGSNSTNPQVASDADGNVLAVWQRTSGSTVYMESALNPLGTGWLAAKSNLALASNAAYPKIAFDSEGNLFAIWQLTNGITSNVIQTAENWGTPVTLSSTGGTTNSAGKLVVDSSDNVYAFWNGYQGSNYLVQSASTRSSQPEPPVPTTMTSGSVVQKIANFGVYQERYNYLSWQASSSAGVAAYYVFRNGTLIAVLGPSQLSYEDHNQAKRETVTYTVTAVNSQGQQSSSLTLTYTSL